MHGEVTQGEGGRCIGGDGQVPENGVSDEWFGLGWSRQGVGQAVSFPKKNAKGRICTWSFGAKWHLGMTDAEGLKRGTWPSTFSNIEEVQQQLSSSPRRMFVAAHEIFKSQGSRTRSMGSLFGGPPRLAKGILPSGQLLAAVWRPLFPH
ncbi:unnamed protein product [Ostreobium quekettii]|uniref:Uncharacterized protein n=1 Tax=Ostreobium quekettii TaxID=121088 RepID=A0A8S1IKX6_9CHLO|nr:unnamed protein product [Ostreobium quekettii]